MTEVKMCDFCGEMREVGRLGAIGTVEVRKTGSYKEGTICANCCPDKWVSELFSDHHVERFECDHDNIDVVEQGDQEVRKCTDCNRVFEVIG